MGLAAFVSVVVILSSVGGSSAAVQPLCGAVVEQINQSC
jgi:hypothetical protein